MLNSGCNIVMRYRHAVELGDADEMSRIEAEAEKQGMDRNDLNRLVLETYRSEGAPV